MRNQRRQAIREQQSFIERIERLASVSVQDAERMPGVESNPSFRGGVLIGTGPEYVGQLQTMRTTDPVVAPGVDFLKAECRSIEIEVEPPDNPTPMEVRATDALRDMLTTGVRGGISSLFARVADRWITSGFCAMEIIQRPSRYAGRQWDVEFFELVPWSIREIRTTSNGAEIAEVQQLGLRGKRVTVPSWKLSWCVNMPAPGAFTGYSLLRPALAVSLWYETLIKNGLNRSLVDRGVPILEQTVAEVSTTDQFSAADRWAEHYVDGAIGPLRLPYGLKLDMFTPSAAADNPLPLLQYLDTLKRQVTATTLQTLGTSATGSRALGETFAVSDRKRFSAWVGEILDDLNGEGDYPGGDIVRPMLQILGFPVRTMRPPRLTAPGFDRADIRDNVEQVVQLIGRGMPVGGEDWAAIRTAVGLPEAPGDAAPTERTVADDRLSRSACGHSHAADFSRTNEDLPLLAGEEHVDYDAVERLIDRAAESAASTLQALSEEHRREFMVAAAPLIRSGDVAAIATLEVDYASVYREDILDTLQRVDRGSRRIQLDELRRAGVAFNAGAPPLQYAEGEPTPTDRMRALATLKAAQVNDEVNEQLRNGAMEAVDTGDDSVMAAFVLGATVASGLVTAAAVQALATAQDDEVRRVREGAPTLAVHTERMDANTCQPCRDVHGRVYVVGSPQYRRNRPPYRLCESAKGPRGNLCRGYLIYLEP